VDTIVAIVFKISMERALFLIFSFEEILGSCCYLITKAC